jgi:TolA-binding protein
VTLDLDQLVQGGPLKVRDVWSRERTAHLPHEVLQHCRRRAMRRALVSASVLSVVGATTLLFWSARTPDLAGKSLATVTTAQASYTFKVARAAPLTVKTVTFKDGSRAELAGSVSRISVQRDVKEHVDLRLLAGHARFEVVKNPKRTFDVRSGAVRVHVIGTSFSVARVSEQTRVTVDRGRVEVYWNGGKAELAAGESGVFPPGGAALEGEGAPAANKRVQRGPEWRSLAQKGEYKNAYSALNDSPDSVREVPEELMLAADVARLSGNPARAVPYLKTVSERFARDPRAPLAAFTLGRVLLDSTGNATSAAAAFRRARTLSPRGPLALDAWSREVESLRRAGRSADASALAQKYLEEYPNGRHASALRGVAGD